MYAVDGGYEHHNLLWSVKLPDAIENLATMTDGTSPTYAATSASLHAIDQGQEIWHVKHHSADQIFSVLVSIDGTTVFAAWTSGDGSFIEALDAMSGEKLWRADFKEAHVTKLAKQIDYLDNLVSGLPWH